MISIDSGLRRNDVEMGNTTFYGSINKWRHSLSGRDDFALQDPTFYGAVAL